MRDVWLYLRTRPRFWRTLRSMNPGPFREAYRSTRGLGRVNEHAPMQARIQERFSAHI
jgi:hypothetical protein